MDGVVNNILNDIEECRKDLHTHHERLPEQFRRIQTRLNELLKDGCKSYEQIGNKRHLNDPHLSRDKQVIEDFIRNLDSFAQDITGQTAHLKLEALSKAAREVHRAWHDLFASDYKGMKKVRDKGMDLLKGLVLIAHKEEDLLREAF